MAEVKARKAVHYISGHRDLTPAEFEEHYRPVIDMALACGESFVVGDARGTDAMAQGYLVGKTTAVKVFHMFTCPRHNAGFPTVGGFDSDEARDVRMTAESDGDIAWVRPGRQKSGTQKNLDRRRQQMLADPDRALPSGARDPPLQPHDLKIGER
jgi:hypothetical protein